MKTFVATLKHDQGKFKITTSAQDEKTAREIICKAEGCPDIAIIKIKEVILLSPRLKYRAKKFLDARAKRGSFEALQALNPLTDAERAKVISWLSFHHNVKFI